MVTGTATEVPRDSGQPHPTRGTSEGSGLAGRFRGGSVSRPSSASSCAADKVNSASAQRGHTELSVGTARTHSNL
jgi:hypothetical protein